MNQKTERVMLHYPQVYIKVGFIIEHEIKKFSPNEILLPNFPFSYVLVCFYFIYLNTKYNDTIDSLISWFSIVTAVHNISKQVKKSNEHFIIISFISWIWFGGLFNSVLTP